MTSFPVDPCEPTRAELLAHVAALQGGFASLAAIEQAKGAVMATYGLTADAAFDLLRSHSQTRKVKLRAVAAQLTTLVSSSPINSDAITRFDRLIDTVINNLQNPDGSTHQPSAPGSPAGLVALLSPATADRDIGAAQQPAPGVTIAGNVPWPASGLRQRGFCRTDGIPDRRRPGPDCRFLQGPGTDPKPDDHCNPPIGWVA